jgi:hypothetical protein
MGYDTEDAMIDAKQIETHLQDAIALLDESGFPMAAEALRDHLRGIRTAPTGAARRRRILQLRGLFDGPGPAPDVFYARYGTQQRDESRYQRTLDAIQELLAEGATNDETGSQGWTASIARVA